jgi:hypothetical protein
VLPGPLVVGILAAPPLPRFAPGVVRRGGLELEQPPDGLLGNVGRNPRTDGRNPVQLPMPARPK